MNKSPHLSISEMRKNPYYSIYYINMCRLIVLGIVPFALLIFYNCAIYTKMKKTSELFAENIYNSRERLRRNQENNSAARVLFAIVGLCIVCHSLRFCLNFYEMMWINKVLSCSTADKDGFPPWSYIVEEFSRILMILNSFVNSIIYCCLNAEFRKKVVTFKTSFKRKWSNDIHTAAITATAANTNYENKRNCDSVVEMQPIVKNV